MRKLLSLCAILFAIGCGDSTSPILTVAGTWSLQSVDGISLPYILEQVGADKAELTSDVITANSTGSFTETTNIKITEGGQVTNESFPDAGTYTQSGSAVTFTFNSDGSSGTATLNGNTLTMTTAGFSLVYTR
jgi:hypothetical protein